MEVTNLAASNNNAWLESVSLIFVQMIWPTITFPPMEVVTLMSEATKWWIPSTASIVNKTCRKHVEAYNCWKRDSAPEINLRNQWLLQPVTATPAKRRIPLGQSTHNNQATRNSNMSLNLHELVLDQWSTKQILSKTRRTWQEDATRTTGKSLNQTKHRLLLISHRVTIRVITKWS